jgi:hypothetical protein
VSWLLTHVTAPVGVVGGVVLLVIGAVEAVAGGKGTVGLLVMGGLWLLIGLLLLPPAFRRRLRGRA